MFGKSFFQQTNAVFAHNEQNRPCDPMKKVSKTFQNYLIALFITPFDRARQGEHIHIKFSSFQAIFRLKMNFKVLTKGDSPPEIPVFPCVKSRNLLNIRFMQYFQTEYDILPISTVFMYSNLRFYLL